MFEEKDLERIKEINVEYRAHQKIMDELKEEHEKEVCKLVEKYARFKIGNKVIFRESEKGIITKITGDSSASKWHETVRIGKNIPVGISYICAKLTKKGIAHKSHMLDCGWSIKESRLELLEDKDV